MNFQQKNVPDVSYARHFVCGGEKQIDYLEDGRESGGRVVGGGVWIEARAAKLSSKPDVRSVQFCA